LRYSGVTLIDFPVFDFMIFGGNSLGGRVGMSTVIAGVQNKVIHGDCLEVMPTIPDKSIDMILCDLPYGTTACKWDTVIPFEPLWAQYERIIKDNGAIVLFGSEPFSSYLRLSNIKNYKYDWMWDKRKGGNIMNLKQQPYKTHENIMVFGGGNYYPIMEYQKERTGRTYSAGEANGISNYGDIRTYKEKYPKSVITFSNAQQKGKLHPTQKPVALFEYLIKTYTNEGETVLDNCIGSGTTAIACINTGRNYIGIEKDKSYYDIAVKRIAEHERQLTIC
jgi:site-specific DNA-methyltransferase (adenine-specific)